MGKIRIRDLAAKMGVAEQDLAFKLKSIGVRVEGEDSLIDTDMIQAILQGKQLPQTPMREVIMRDKEAPAAAPKRRPRRPPPPGPLRPPPRRRPLVNKAETKIRTLPGRGRPDAKPATPEEVAAQEIAAEEATRADAAPSPAAPAGPARIPSAPASARSPATPARSPATPRSPATTRSPATSARPPARSATAAARAAAAAGEPTSRRDRRRLAQDSREDESEAIRAAGGTITISEGMRVRELADKLGMKAKDLLKHLIQHGVMASVNHVVEPELARTIAEQLGYEATVVSFEKEVQLQHEASTEARGGEAVAKPTEPRAPVVTVMGHVDHGKTSLLDAIRSSRLTDAEAGGITQHIAAYSVELPGSKRVVFLDTPGHEAFTQLRARGAKVTDIVVLVVAADDGVMPQTVEAIQHARAAGVPIVIAMNKIDRDNANPERLKKQLAEHQLLVEEWGGDTVAVPVSATKKQGISELLEMILLTADLLELRADSTIPAQGVVIEARKEAGRGVVATLLVQNGTLRVGQAFVTGSTWGRVRSMTNDLGERVDEAGPSTAIEVAGFDDLPEAGDALQVVEKEAQARSIAELRTQDRRHRELAPTLGRLTLESLFSKIEAGTVHELPVIIKADVQGSVEVLKETLEKLSTDKVKVKVIGAGAGAISTNDVLLASASQAIIYGFNVRPERNAMELADREEVDIRTHTVIYELTDELKKAMVGMLEPEYREVEQGRAEVRELFKVPKIGTIAGCHVVEGIIPRSATVRLVRDNVVIFEGRVSSLRRFKDDASEVRSGFDCGIGLDRFQDLKPGDLIEAYTQEAIAPSL